MNKHLSHITKTFVRQQDQADCGVACLSSIINYYGGISKMENLRELSGTSKNGTTLLGLIQSAKQLGFEAIGYEADINYLRQVNDPCILHILMNGNLDHYIIYYPSNAKLPNNVKGEYPLFGDPGRGLINMTYDELNDLWKSKVLLSLKPTEKFIQVEKVYHAKLNWFTSLLKDDYNILIVTIFLGIIIAGLGLSTAMFSQKLIDEILPLRNFEKLTIGSILLFVLLSSRTALIYLRQHFLLLQNKDFNTRITSNFYEKLIYLPKSFFDHRKTGDMISRMNDTMRIQKSVAYISGTFFIDVLIVLVSGVYLFSYSLIIASIAFLSVPIMFIVATKFHKNILDGQQQIMAAYAKNESNYIDTIQGVNAIKESGKEQFFINTTKSIYTFFQNKSFNLGTVVNKFSFFTELTSILILISVISTIAYLVLEKQQTIGEMIAILAVVTALIPTVNRLALTNLLIQEAKVAFDRMYEFVSIEPEFTYNQPLIANNEKLINFESLSLNSISFRFPGRKTIIENVSLNIKKGEFVSLIGESGCGKSTILQLIQRYYTPENGEIKVNGENIDEFYTLDWRKVIATVPQDIKIFNGTILYNIALSDEMEIIKEIQTFCIRYGFDKYFKEFPQGYLTLVGEEGINLSGGQKQLVAIARALIQKPQLLLLDEATSSMDKNTESFIINLLLKLKEDIAIILVTHQIETARSADIIYIIEKGKIRESEIKNLIANT